MYTKFGDITTWRLSFSLFIFGNFAVKFWESVRKTYDIAFLYIYIDYLLSVHGVLMFKHSGKNDAFSYRLLHSPMIAVKTLCCHNWGKFYS